MSNTTGFAGEEYLTTPLPDYSGECWVLSIKLLAVAGFWIFALPYTWSVLTSQSAPKGSKSSERESKTATTKNEEEEELSVNVFVTALAAIGCIASMVYLLIQESPYNYFLARGAFEVPVLNQDECQEILQMASAAAERNHQAALLASNSSHAPNATIRGLLQEPLGWQKDRHGHYPTTDMNLVTDPFTTTDLEWIQIKLDARLSPVLERIYGIPRASIRANDMFVVRYDAGHRTHLAKHTDDNDISFNILLTEDFEGGGTRFYDRTTDTPFAHLQPTRAGQLVTHSATIQHEGVPIAKGSRIIFVGFLSVDHKNPFSSSSGNKKATGLSLYASWLSIPWMMVKFREAQAAADHRIQNGLQKWSNNKYVQALFLDMTNLLEELGDFFCPHHAHKLVRDEDAEAYLQSLDSRAALDQFTTKASWFSGQQVQLDIDGTVNHEYPTRRRSIDKFKGLL